jgi:hypothetical protein
LAPFKTHRKTTGPDPHKLHTHEIAELLFCRHLERAGLSEFGRIGEEIIRPTRVYL